ncbi:MAG: hypothetical protein HXY42_13580 [Chloroflexi bacterium]|nr:hypothetical protein [Chloroflexota bacterium]
MKLTPFQLTRYGFSLTAAILIAFGIGSLIRIGANPAGAGLYAFYAALMFLDAAFMVFCAFQLHKGTKFFFYFSVFVLAVNILLPLFDQFGLPDLLFVLSNLAALTALIMARREFLPA